MKTATQRTQGKWKEKITPTQIEIYSGGEESELVCKCGYGQTVVVAEANAEYICKSVNNHDSLVEALKKFLDLKYIGNFKAGELDYPDDFLALRMDAQILLNKIQNESK